MQQLTLEDCPASRTFRLAYLNAVHQSGFCNPIDEAIKGCPPPQLGDIQKHDEVPYDFIRKRLSVLLDDEGTRLLVTKGAVENVLAACSEVEAADGSRCPLENRRIEIRRQFDAFSSQGHRTLGIAWREMPGTDQVGKADERLMTFAGFLVLDDPPKEGIAQTVDELRRLGVSLKMITGDNRLVAASVAQRVGLKHDPIVTGSDLRTMSDEALRQKTSRVDTFAEIEPNQKERIVLALRKAGHVVGYLGDGINDATALHAADVGISVDQAVDVAKEAADIVLLRHDLTVLLDGVREGRKTFANTLKYVFMATSANFGNMFSVAGAALLVDFLPLLPKQILLMNLLTDLPEMAIAADRVDPEMVLTPRRWNIRFIRRFMLVFGPLSSVFDFLTFGALIWVTHADHDQFRTAWFLESVISAALIVLVVRTRRSIFVSRPHPILAAATAAAIAITLAIPWSPLAAPLGFCPIPARLLLLLAGIIGLYLAAAEAAKWIFYRYWES